jgi:hypothetical protein
MGRRAEEYTMLAQAHRRVEEILAGPFEYAAPPDAVRRLRDYVRDFAAQKQVSAPEWTD